jgi:hypothetical protein
MSIAGYVSVCMQLYFVGFHCFTTCFGLHGHLQECRIFYFHMLEGFCFAAFFPAFFLTWSHSAENLPEGEEALIQLLEPPPPTNSNHQSTISRAEVQEVINSLNTSVLTRPTRRHFPEE